MFNNEEMIRDLFSGQLSTALANTDYIIALLNMKVAENIHDEKKVEVLTEVLNDIKLILTDVESQEVH